MLFYTQLSYLSNCTFWLVHWLSGVELARDKNCEARIGRQLRSGQIDELRQILEEYSRIRERLYSLRHVTAPVEIRGVTGGSPKGHLQMVVEMPVTTAPPFF